MFYDNMTTPVSSLDNSYKKLTNRSHFPFKVKEQLSIDQQRVSIELDTLTLPDFNMYRMLEQRMLNVYKESVSFTRIFSYYIQSKVSEKYIHSEFDRNIKNMKTHSNRIVFEILKFNKIDRE